MTVHLSYRPSTGLTLRVNTLDCSIMFSVPALPTENIPSYLFVNEKPNSEIVPLG